MNIYTSTNSLEEFFSESTQLNCNIKSKENQEKFYNYIYLDPRKPGQYCYEGLNMSFLFEPFYVGKGSSNRYGYNRKFKHIDKHELEINPNKQKTNKIKKILSENYNLKEFIWQINSKLTDQQSKDIEVNLIAKIGRKDLGLGPLTNLTDGGEGVKGYNNLHVSPKKGKTKKEITNNPDWVSPNKGKTMKEITRNENYKSEKKGKTFKELYGDDYIDCRKGKSSKKIYGESWINPRLGKIYSRITCPICGKEMVEYLFKKHSKIHEETHES